MILAEIDLFNIFEITKSRDVLDLIFIQNKSIQSYKFW